MLPDEVLGSLAALQFPHDWWWVWSGNLWYKLGGSTTYINIANHSCQWGKLNWIETLTILLKIYVLKISNVFRYWWCDQASSNVARRFWNKHVDCDIFFFIAFYVSIVSFQIIVLVLGRGLPKWKFALVIIFTKGGCGWSVKTSFFLKI